MSFVRVRRPWVSQETRTLLTFMDKDYSGFVTVDEFLQWLDIETAPGVTDALPDAPNTKPYERA